MYYYAHVHYLTVVYSLQMALSQKFRDAVLVKAVQNSSMDIQKRYLVLGEPLEHLSILQFVKARY
jgi:hypothetical protein